MLKPFGIAVCLFAFATTPCSATMLVSAAKTADIIESCDKSPNPRAETYCLGYLSAVFDDMSVNEQICTSASVTTIQMVAVARKYFSDHPESWDKSPVALLRAAFAAAFPCAPRKSSN
jgi:hypothetical protein